MIAIVALTFASFLGPALYGMDLWELFEMWFGPDSALYLNGFFLLLFVIAMIYGIIRIKVAIANAFKDIQK